MLQRRHLCLLVFAVFVKFYIDCQYIDNVFVVWRYDALQTQKWTERKTNLNVYLMLDLQEGTDDSGFTVGVSQSLSGHAICKGVCKIGSQMCPQYVSKVFTPGL